MGKDTKPKNELGRLYKRQLRSVRAKIQEDLKAAGVSHQRFYSWTIMPDEKMIEMPTVLKTIICRNIPKAEALFKIPSMSNPTLFDK